VQSVLRLRYEFLKKGARNSKFQNQKIKIEFKIEIKKNTIFFLDFGKTLISLEYFAIYGLFLPFCRYCCQHLSFNIFEKDMILYQYLFFNNDMI
jgi:hypothetical protein